MTSNFIRTASIVSTLLFSAGVAIASGSHSGGHGHGGATMAEIGAPGDPAKVDRTIEIGMGDMFFSMDTIHVEKGETVRFVLKNEGELVHEFGIGTIDMHAEHAEEMSEMVDRGILEADHINHHMTGGMEHDDPNSILLEPGESGEIVWTFSGDADLEFSCNIPGHREGGMFGKFEIEH
jgi:uncharacterized cupredoxin-like copper-binding protein